MSFWRLMDHFESATSIVNATKQDLLKVAGVKASSIAEIISAQEVLRKGQCELERIVKIGGRVLVPGDGVYPYSLMQIADPPPVLFVLGDVDVIKNSGVGVVGSRASTSYGRRVAYSLSKELASKGVTVISGLALGIDGEAHAGALDGGGNTAAVLGCGLDVIYPKQNKQLYESIANKGLLVTEYPLGTKPEGFRFPARNRIISGLSAGVLVVEAAKKSGSLITAQMALDENREVFAVPGQIDSFKSEGTHWLLKQGAKLVQSVEDILAELPELKISCNSIEKDLPVVGREMDEKESIILGELEAYPISRDVLIERTSLKPSQVSEYLLFLELDGMVELLPGDEVRKII